VRLKLLLQQDSECLYSIVFADILSPALAPPINKGYMVNNSRPVNLDLTTIKLPLPAIVSILHRLSGVLMFFFVPVLLWMLQHSLKSSQGFEQVADCFSGHVAKFILWFFVAGLLFHLVAGIRHMIMDLGFGESLEGGRRGAKIIVVLSIVLIALAGIWLW